MSGGPRACSRRPEAVRASGLSTSGRVFSSLQTMRTSNTGFTLIELIVGLAIMIMISAVITPVMLGALDKARIDEAAASLESLVEALHVFHDDTNHYPGYLTHLSAPITTSQTNSCGDSYPQGAADKWNGPYVKRVLTSSGVPVAIGTARDELIRESLDSGGLLGAANPKGGAALLKIVVTDVAEEDAVALNERVDGDNSSTDGTVQWTVPDAQGFVTLYYITPISGC
jgi:prepilin-type N-terminal cleavage/methylation domain-containing protein